MKNTNDIYIVIDPKHPDAEHTEVYSSHADAILASAKSLDLVVVKKTIEAPAPVTVGKKKQKVTTICYGKRDTWNSVKDALDYFNEAANCSDGCERERYLTIVSKLLGGETKDVSDEW